jgi:LuxR family maltose regulon positive regulatory protein
LVERLLAAPAAPVICVVAPLGYGKTTLLGQWAGRKGGRVGWVTVDQRDNDPVVLLTYLAVALDRIEPIDPGMFHALAAPGATVAGMLVPRLTAAVAAMTQPVALVVDNLESLENLACLDALAEVAMHLPQGSQLALGCRTKPRLPGALLGAPARVVAVGPDQLRMDREEAGALLAGAGVQLAEAEAAELVRRTEGWPVGLYLAALAHQTGPAGGAPRDTGGAFTGDDRFMADYLQAELLSRLPRSHVVPDPDGGAGANVRAAVRSGPGHHRLGRPVGVAGRVQPVADPPGPATTVVPLPPPAPRPAPRPTPARRTGAGAPAAPAGRGLV